MVEWCDARAAAAAAAGGEGHIISFVRGVGGKKNGMATMTTLRKRALLPPPPPPLPQCMGGCYTAATASENYSGSSRDSNCIKPAKFRFYFRPCALGCFAGVGPM